MTLLEAAQLFSPLIAVAVAFGMLKKGLSDQETSNNGRHAENQSRLSEIESRVGDIRENGATVRSELSSFQEIEAERHVKTDVAIDELKGGTNRLSGVVNQIQVWQAGTHEKLDHMTTALRELSRKVDPSPSK